MEIQKISNVVEHVIHDVVGACLVKTHVGMMGRHEKERWTVLAHADTGVFHLVGKYVVEAYTNAVGRRIALAHNVVVVVHTAETHTDLVVYHHCDTANSDTVKIRNMMTVTTINAMAVTTV